MSTAAATIEPKRGILDSIFDGVGSMLRPEAAGGFSATEEPVAATVRAVALAFGAKLPPGSTAAPGEPLDEAIDRVARSAGLIAREIHLGEGWHQAVALPVIAVRRSNGAPVALLPGALGWRLVDGGAPSRPIRLTAEVIADLGTDAFALGPALPDKAIKWKELLLYGVGTKIPDLLLYAAMSLLAGLALSCLPIANTAVTGIVIPDRDLLLLMHIAAMLVGLSLASLATRLSAKLCEVRIDGRTGSMLRSAAADRVIRLARADDAKSISPAAAALVTRCVESWHRAVWHILLTVLAGLLVALPSLVVVMRSTALGAGLLLGVMLAAIAVSVIISRRQVASLFNGPCSPTSWISASYEALAHIVTVRSLGVEQHLYKRFADSFLGLKDRFLVSDRMGAKIHALEACLEALVVAIAITIVAVFVRTMSTHDSVAFTLAVMTVAGAAVTIVHAFGQASMIGLQHRMIQPVLTGVPPPASMGAAPGQLSGAIEISELVVKPDPNGRAILSDISLSVSPGQHIAIVGPSGSGKSTLLNAILGMIKTHGGLIRYDGTDLSQLDAAAVRRQIGVVGQSGRLFPGTLKENIAAGLPLTQEEAWAALRTAALEDEVRAMPLGLSTPIGDADPVLSTGQIQRLLMARAVAHRPKLLILDEATSALDPAAEALVAAAVRSLEATVISVAHRLDTIRHCDAIHVLDGGRIVESGTFEELAEGSGPFAELVAAEARAHEATASDDTQAELDAFVTALLADE